MDSTAFVVFFLRGLQVALGDQLLPGPLGLPGAQVMMNLVTGVFVDGAQRIAKEEKNQDRR